MNIEYLLKSKNVAIIGATEKAGFGRDTCKNVMTYMDSQNYFFVNPSRKEVLGVKCYKSISDIPKPVDLMVICTPKHTVEKLIIEGSKNGVKGVVVYASGYGEVGTEEGQQEEESLSRLCMERNIALMGPNCAGFANFIDKVHPFAFLSDYRDRKGSVGVVSQSGQLILSMMDNPKMRFSYAISSGNSKISTVEDYLEYLVNDQDTRVIAAYLEGVSNPLKFVRVLKNAAKRRKPIVVLKPGRSQKGVELVASHTGSLSGSDRVYDALFEKFGVIRVNDLEELMTTAQALATIKKLPEQKKGLACISLSGGETGICADLGEQVGLHYPNFEKKTLEELKRVLPSYAAPNNPLDSTATLSYDTEKFASVLEAVMKDPNIGIVSVGYTLLQEISDNAIHYMTEALKLVCAEDWSKPVVMIPFAENTRHEGYVEALRSIGVPVLSTSAYGFRAIRNIQRFSEYTPEDKNLEIPLFNKTENQIIESESINALTESESKKIIQAYGINCGRFEVAHSRDEAVRIFREMRVKKAVAKIDSPDILHKTDIGCVKLSLETEEEIRVAYDEIIENAKKNSPTSRIMGVQICEMVPKGTELIVGVSNDPQFGPSIMFGIGGVFVEVFQDTVLGMAPLSREEVNQMLSQLKGIKLLEGYRGQKKLDMEAFIDVIVKVSQLACDHDSRIKELDINPIFLYEKGVCAVDALYIKK